MQVSSKQMVILKEKYKQAKDFKDFKPELNFKYISTKKVSITTQNKFKFMRILLWEDQSGPMLTYSFQ